MSVGSGRRFELEKKNGRGPREYTDPALTPKKECSTKTVEGSCCDGLGLGLHKAGMTTLDQDIPDVLQ
jgi:hypothetical protein